MNFCYLYFEHFYTLFPIFFKLFLLSLSLVSEIAEHNFNLMFSLTHDWIWSGEEDAYLKGSIQGQSIAPNPISAVAFSWARAPHGCACSYLCVCAHHDSLPIIYFSFWLCVWFVRQSVFIAHQMPVIITTILVCIHTYMRSCGTFWFFFIFSHSQFAIIEIFFLLFCLFLFYSLFEIPFWLNVVVLKKCQLYICVMNT